MTTAVRALALAITLAAVSTPELAAAQNASLNAISGSIRLRSGFTPDPYRASVTAGGGIDAYRDTDLPAACVGKISDAPDFEVTYSDAGSLPLVFRTISSSDTTLIINGPDGQWRCDDDSYGDGDAEVRFNNPRNGTYDVWIGSFNGGLASTTLLITETP
ncbi:peptidase S1 [Brevundimonas sp. NPDC092305]|uniref:peptidase S1 n=1 Tax=Brevundimonas sp. NPDC092305 TaxID=3363957 RepID=UPI003818B199